MFAQMIAGKADTADWFFFIAAILALLAAVTALPIAAVVKAAKWGTFLGWAAITFLAVAWWVL